MKEKFLPWFLLFCALGLSGTAAYYSVVGLSIVFVGVASYQYKTGWVVYNTWTEQVLEFPTYQQHIEYEDQGVILKGGFSATIKPTFNYSLREDAIGDMFVNLRRDIKDVDNWKKGYEFSISKKGINHIKQEEKLRLKAYDIGDGMITIGYGHAEPMETSKYKLVQVYLKKIVV